MMKHQYKIVYPTTKPDYIGLKIKEGKIEFVFPCNYEKALTEDELKRDMLNLIKVINKYKGLKDINDSFKQDNMFPFQTYLWIIKDYLNNGYYSASKRVYLNNNRGKINWKKTIKNNDIFLDNDNIIYKSFIVCHNINDSQNVLTNIHKFCVFEAVNKMGWYYNLSSSVVDSNFLKYSKNVMLNILRKSYNSSYTDNDKILINNMIKLIEGLDENKLNSKEFDISTTEFEYVFERLIDERFGNVNVKDYYPNASWHIDGKKYDSSNLRPDTIMIKNDKAYIIDAKYYAYGYTNNVCDLPDTSSIQKQITYAEELLNRCSNINYIYSIFLLPTSSINYLEYFGYADTSWKQDGQSYEKIYSFLIDLKTLINDFSNDKEFYQERLLQKINEVI